MTEPKSSPENPWPVSKLNGTVKKWIERLGWLWVEGQLTQINVKPTWKMSYLTLRDTQEQISVQLTAETALLRSLPTPERRRPRRGAGQAQLLRGPGVVFDVHHGHPPRRRG